MIGNLLARLLHVAPLGFAVLAAANALLLGWAWLGFASARPDYAGWPTFSRALTVGDHDVHRALAAVAGAGLIAGATALAFMFVRLAGARTELRPALWLKLAACCGAAALGVVHYFHVAITLAVNNDIHMALSYAFFFGMSGVIAVDLYTSRRFAAAGLVLHQHRMRGTWGLLFLGVATVFLATYVLKDVAANPWAEATQRVFVAAETGWIVLAHLYACLWLPAARAHFRARLEPLPMAAQTERAQA